MNIKSLRERTGRCRHEQYVGNVIAEMFHTETWRCVDCGESRISQDLRIFDCDFTARLQ
jgi:hypothetical protein